MLEKVRFGSLDRELYLAGELVKQAHVKKQVISRLLKPIFKPDYLDLFGMLTTLPHEMPINANNLAFFGLTLAS
jgi:hypothetical protein